MTIEANMESMFDPFKNVGGKGLVRVSANHGYDKRIECKVRCACIGKHLSSAGPSEKAASPRRTPAHAAALCNQARDAGHGMTSRYGDKCIAHYSIRPGSI